MASRPWETVSTALGQALSINHLLQDPEGLPALLEPRGTCKLDLVGEALQALGAALGHEVGRLL